MARRHPHPRGLGRLPPRPRPLALAPARRRLSFRRCLDGREAASPRPPSTPLSVPIAPPPSIPGATAPVRVESPTDCSGVGLPAAFPSTASPRTTPTASRPTSSRADRAAPGIRTGMQLRQHPLRHTVRHGSRHITAERSLLLPLVVSGRIGKATRPNEPVGVVPGATPLFSPPSTARPCPRRHTPGPTFGGGRSRQN